MRYLLTLNITKSVNKIPIRMTDERWFHIVENHDDLAGRFGEILNTVEYPDYVLKGYGNALIALKELGTRKYLAVVYKESNEDGFIITAYTTSKIKIEKQVILWQRQK
jgi:hypothetical protein